MVMMVMRQAPSICEWSAIGRRVAMVIRVMTDVHDVLTFFMVCTVHTRCRPSSLQRHEHDQENEQPATHYLRF